MHDAMTDDTTVGIYSEITGIIFLYVIIMMIIIMMMIITTVTFEVNEKLPGNSKPQSEVQKMGEEQRKIPPYY